MWESSVLCFRVRCVQTLERLTLGADKLDCHIKFLPICSFAENPLVPTFPTPFNFSFSELGY